MITQGIITSLNSMAIVIASMVPKINNLIHVLSNDRQVAKLQAQLKGNKEY